MTREVKLDRDNLSVVYSSATVHLLPKEFELLEFLYENEGRVFSRNQLLDAVWPGEDPVDRTVDDHIYRLRKKLKHASNFPYLSIETVRGRGYRFVHHESPSKGTQVTNPATPFQTEAYKAQLREMFYHYVRLGHGAGIQALSASSETFGLTSDRELFVSARFQAGSFHDVVMDQSLPFATRLPWMMYLCDSLERDAERALQIAEYVVNGYLLPLDHHREMICFQLPMLYLKTGNLDLGWQLIQDAVLMADVMDWDGYIPALRLQEVIGAIYRRDQGGASEKLKDAWNLLHKQPWQREVAHAKMIEGYLALAKGDTDVGRERVLHGLNHLEGVGVVPHLITRTNQALHFVERIAPTPSLALELRVRWNTLANRYNFKGLLNAIECELKERLGFSLPL